jgi:hypothetical protein
VSLSDAVLIEFVHVRKDEGWQEAAAPTEPVSAPDGQDPTVSGPDAQDVPLSAPNEDLLPGGGGKATLQHLYFGNFLEKRSVRRVAPEGDVLCLGMCVVIGKAHTEWELACEMHGKKSAEASAAKKIYKKLSNNLGRNTFVKKAVADLYKAAGEDLLTMGNLKLLGKFEEVTGICAKVVSLNESAEIVYNKGKKAQKIVYLLYYRGQDQAYGHYDLITNIRGFYSKENYCKMCDVAFKLQGSHKCKDIPKDQWCFFCHRRECKEAGLTTPCTVCKRPI